MELNLLLAFMTQSFKYYRSHLSNPREQWEHNFPICQWKMRLAIVLGQPTGSSLVLSSFLFSTSH